MASVRMPTLMARLGSGGETAEWTKLFRSADVISRLGTDNPRVVGKLNERPRSPGVGERGSRPRTPFGRVASLSHAGTGLEKDSWLTDIDERKLRYHVMPMHGDPWSGELISYSQKGAIGMSFALETDDKYL